MIVQLVDWNREDSYPPSSLHYVEGGMGVEEVGSSIPLAPSQEAVVLSIVRIVAQVDCSYGWLSKDPLSSKLIDDRIVCRYEHRVSLLAIELLQPVEKSVCRRRIVFSSACQIIKTAFSVSFFHRQVKEALHDVIVLEVGVWC